MDSVETQLDHHRGFYSQKERGTWILGMAGSCSCGELITEGARMGARGRLASAETSAPICCQR